MDLPVPAPVEERLFTSDFIFATLANFFNAFGSQMVTATLPVYVLALGGTDADAGLVSGALAFSALVMRPLIGTSCYGLASLIYMMAGSVPVLILGRIVHGYGLSNYTTAANAYLADIAPPRRRASRSPLSSSRFSPTSSAKSRSANVQPGRRKPA